MSALKAKRLAWMLVALSLSLAVGAYAFVLRRNWPQPGQDLFGVAITVVFIVAGLVIATRQAGNAIGWLFLGVAASAALASFAGAYASYWIETGAARGTSARSPRSTPRSPGSRSSSCPPPSYCCCSPTAVC